MRTSRDAGTVQGRRFGRLSRSDRKGTFQDRRPSAVPVPVGRTTHEDDSLPPRDASGSGCRSIAHPLLVRSVVVAHVPAGVVREAHENQDERRKPHESSVVIGVSPPELRRRNTRASDAPGIVRDASGHAQQRAQRLARRHADTSPEASRVPMMTVSKHAAHVTYRERGTDAANRRSPSAWDGHPKKPQQTQRLAATVPRIVTEPEGIDA